MADFSSFIKVELFLLPAAFVGLLKQYWMTLVFGIDYQNQIGNKHIQIGNNRNDIGNKDIQIGNKQF